MKPRGPRIPSVELQTLTFVEMARSKGGSHDTLLRCHGFRVSLEYEQELTVRPFGPLKGVLGVFDVYVPSRYRRCGWLTAYLKLCQMLADEAVVVGDTYGPVREALLRRGFVEVSPGVPMLIKHASP